MPPKITHSMLLFLVAGATLTLIPAVSVRLRSTGSAPNEIESSNGPIKLTPEQQQMVESGDVRIFVPSIGNGSNIINIEELSAESDRSNNIDLYSPTRAPMILFQFVTIPRKRPSGKS